MIGSVLAAMGWLVESFLVALIGKGVDHLVQQYGEQPGVQDDFRKLKVSFDNALLKIRTIENLWLKEEGEQQILTELLIGLKDAVYDADDLLDEFQYRSLKQQIEQQGDEAGNRASSSSYSTPPPSKKIKTSLSSYASGLFGKGDDGDDNDVQRMREIKGRLDDYSDALEKIYSSLGTEDDRGKKQLVSSASRQTSSFSAEPQLFGRDKELQKLKAFLLEPEEVASEFGQSGFSVLSIYGIGGIGKTTLVQEAFNDSIVKEYFELRIWVCVSENFCTDRLAREIIEYATKVKCDLTNFAALQEVLKEKITPERFLLVLDDVWNEDRHKWEALCAPLRSGKPGSKILVTTRSRKIADMVSDVDAIHLEGLDEDYFWEFFKKCAFGSSKSGVHHPHLEAMAKEMICKLKGLPLAAKTLGGLLSMKLDEQYWKSILDSKIWQLPHEENGIMPVLQLSYQYLPPHLKQCFAFCSLFPKDYGFSESKLINIWIAEGFIVPQGSTGLEELGSNYFHELANRSLFQKWYGFFNMHDLIHDLAELISVGESYRIEKGKSHEIPSTIRHLSVHEEQEGMQAKILTEKFSQYNKLRTLMLSSRYTSKHFILDCGVLEKLKKIRVLVLRNCPLEELPDSIGKLIHLRFLDLSNNDNIRRLPESLCDLYNLQTLILFNCPLKELPDSIGKLIHLCYLDLSNNFNIIRLPESLCNLYNLQSLILDNCLLEELPNSIGKLIHLRFLDLSFNRNIQRLPESLCDLYNLHALILYNCRNLESLPHGMMKLINLRKLAGVDRFIPGITEVGKLTSLQNLPLFKVLKDNGHKLAELKGLKQLQGGLRITNLENVENKDEASIASLKSKEHLDRLELEWTPLQESDSDVNLHISEQVLEGLQPHHNLQRLTIRGYNGAKPPNWLHEQVYSRLEALKLENCKRWNDLSVFEQLSQLKSLSLVRIPVQIHSLHKLFDPKVCRFFSQLEDLVLEGITMLEDLPNLGQLPCLKALNIRSLPGVKMIGDRFFATTEEGSCFPRLHTLCFDEMPAWEEFYCSDDRNLFPSLKGLEISNCQKLQMLPPLPPSITALTLNGVGLVDCPRFWKAIDDSSSITNSASLMHLSILNCPNLTSLEQGLLAHQLIYLKLEGITMLEDFPNLGQLPCLRYLNILSLPGVKMIGDTFFATTEEGSCFPRLHLLRFDEMPAWEEFYCSDDRNLFPCLKNLEISNCQKLQMLPPLPPSITWLKLKNVGLADCPRFRKAIDESSGITNSASVTELLIQECPNLRSLEQGLLAHHLQRIHIQKCEQLLWVPVKRLKELTSLRSLSIIECPKLMSMAQDEYIDFQLPPSITQLYLSDCRNLSKSLSGCLHNLTSLRGLGISNCPDLVSLPVETLLNLARVTIKNCNELRSVEGLGIKSLRNLNISGCPKLLLSQGEAQTKKSSLQRLVIDDTAFMKQSVIKNLLSSVKDLRISSSCEAVMFEGEDQESLQSLTSLDSLSFSDCKNLQFLPTKLHTLTSLRYLRIHNCPQIQSLPEKGLPSALKDLQFEGCHLVVEQQLVRYLAEIKKSGRYRKYYFR